MAADLSEDIRHRTFVFSCLVVRLALRVHAGAGVSAIVNQLVRAATSIGANLEEAKAASSRREFVRYVEISLRSAQETLYWLRLCRQVGLANAQELSCAIGEADQIARILAAIVISTKRRMASGVALFAFCIMNFALLPS